MSEVRSYRQILKSTSIIGGASAINVVIALLRTKIAALVLGPAGIGLIGLLQSVMVTASSVASLGLNTVGTRQIAEAVGKEDADGLAVARKALFWAALSLSLLGAIVLYALRDTVASQILRAPELSRQLGWLGLGVALSVASGSQTALLNGHRRIRDMASVTVFSAILSTVLGVLALGVWKEQGIVPFVLAAPLASFLLGHFYVARVSSKGTTEGTPWSALTTQWRALFRLGIAFMFTGLVVNVAQVAVRTLIKNQLGDEPLGLFQSAWSVSMTYVGFVLGAMGTDYYPRLTAVLNTPQDATRLVNQQTEIALLLAGPVLLVIIGLAPWIIALLYSDNFAEAARILQWQALGDVFKVAAWPLAFVLLAAGKARTYFVTESLTFGAFVAFTGLGLPLLGIEATGIAFLAMQLLNLPLLYVLVRRRIGLTWTAEIRKLFASLASGSLVVLAFAAWHPLAAAMAGISLATVFGIYALHRLAHMSEALSSPRVRGLLARFPLNRFTTRTDR